MSTPEWLAAAQAAAPLQIQQTTPGRWLLVDGDALAYTCGGPEDTGEARRNLLGRVEQAKRASGAERVGILVTGRGSDKGQRYKIATVKPYQGNRSSGRRPATWEFLRGLLETKDLPWPVVIADDAEADDVFHQTVVAKGAENCVIHTQDKDLRMVPGHHLTWNDMQMHYLPPGVFASVFGDKLYGTKWFWTQMLMGDTADNIPGLPKMTKPDGKQALCGEVGAGKLLEHCLTNDDAFEVVSEQYRLFYNTPEDNNAGIMAMLEQAALIWMRCDPTNILDVCAPGRPLERVSETSQMVFRKSVKLR